MDFRNIIVSNVDVKGNKGKPNSYLFLDKIPIDLYKLLYIKTLTSEVTLDNFTVSISDKDGRNTFNVNQGGAISEDFYAYLELEFRGMLDHITPEGNLTLSEDYTVVAHFWFQDTAVCIALEDHDIVLKDIKKKLQTNNVKVSKNIVKGVSNNKPEYFPEVTKYFTKRSDSEKFHTELEGEDYQVNIVTTKIKVSDVERDILESDLL